MTVPSVSKAGRRLRSFSGSPRAWLLVDGHHARRALFLRDLDRDDLTRELAVGLRLASAAVRFGGVGVLLFAAHLLFARAQLGAAPHVHVAVGVPEPVQDHGVQNLAVAEAHPLAGLGQEVGGEGHRLHPARHDQVGLAGPDGVCAPGPPP